MFIETRGFMEFDSEIIASSFHAIFVLLIVILNNVSQFFEKYVNMLFFLLPI